MSKNISGFPEFLPAEQIAFNKLVSQIKSEFELHGFTPLDTAVVERVDTLLAKGNDNEIYGIYRLAEQDIANSSKDLGLRFDLTVPLARYTSSNYGSLVFPYKRYHIAPVWRGERPQKGRYRQFYQCDCDCIGDNELSNNYDVEIVSVAYKIFKKINLDFQIKINDVRLLNYALDSFSIEENAKKDVIRTIDKFKKISKEVFIDDLISFGVPKSISEELYTECLNSGKYINPQYKNSDFYKDLTNTISSIKKDRLYDNEIIIDPFLARGLNYYTGLIFELTLNDYQDVGTVCSGGRYDNLASGFGSKKLPGVGMSVGISRLFPKLLEIGYFDISKSTIADVLVTVQEKDCIESYLDITQKLRDFGIKTEIYFQNKDLAYQIKYAIKKGFEIVIIANKEELASKSCIVKELNSRSQEKILLSELAHYIYSKIPR